MSIPPALWYAHMAPYHPKADMLILESRRKATLWSRELNNSEESKLAEDAENPTCIFNESRIGYRLGQDDTQEEVELRLPD